MIIEALYFFLPAYISNMAPVFLRKLNWHTPISNKLFGHHKTWRGLIGGTLLGGLTFYLQKLAYINGFRDWAIIDYSDFSILLGFLLAFGAMTGDLLESYYKRKNGIKPGEAWPFFDQIDFVIGGLVFGFFVFVPPPAIALTIFVVSPILHILINFVGYLLGIKKNKW